MTNEEKIKAYDEAIERAKRLHREPTGGTERIVCEQIFPELNESEDEKIRNFLIDFIKVCGWTEKKDQGWPLREECLAWLEEQGEQRSSWSEDDERILSKIQDHLREFYVNKKGYPYVAEPNSPEVMEMNWLTSLKDRVQQPK